ncbi:alpha/beta family hydrolase [Yinghuangia seranimata]|uniref:alpha/beta hydrolase family protein n=1 Tax=Yinghuangia seranimata TaxID=408067 RepID=UPI00248B00E9|nr:alpha/beta family hydrolase [Yinghuangia seranimata]MDI2128063.1 hydrolase [Yinghuangia seranimata]
MTRAKAAASPSVHTIETPVGEARATVHAATGTARGWFVTSHGAGGGIEARDLVALAAALPPLGITVALVEQPWRVAGKKLAPAPKRLDEAWVPVVEDLKARMDGLPFAVSGRSAGARVACRTAAASGAAGVVALAFPLHPPGKPAASRADELLGAGVPTLVVQGDKDPFGGPAEFPEPPAGTTLVAVPYADHSFGVAKKAPVTEEDTLALITDTVGDWLVSLFG